MFKKSFFWHDKMCNLAMCFAIFKFKIDIKLLVVELQSKLKEALAWSLIVLQIVFNLRYVDC